MKGKWEKLIDEKQYLINIWILNGLDSKSHPKLLYGYAVPIEGKLDLKKWFVSKVNSEKKIGISVEKLNCSILGADAKKFIDMLERSKTFEKISIELGLSDSKDYFDKLFLLADDYRYRPPIFLETDYASMYYSAELRPKSTLGVNPCICESLVNINKFKILEIDNETSDKELLRFISNSLKGERILNILGTDSQRLGDFEVFDFAYGRHNDIDPLKSSIIKIKENGQFLGDAVKISIKHNVFRGKLYLRCRTRNGNNIIGDQLRLVKDGNTGQDLIFKISEKCSEIEVSVWDAEEASNEKPITLLYENRCSLMRTMSMNTQLMGIKGSLETRWTKKLSNKSGNKSINNKFRKRFRYYSKAGSFEKDPWVPASRDMMDFVKLNFPQKSNAIFFEKGWQDENRFVKWLQEVVGKDKTHRVILIDPYFDAEAVSKFLGLANYSDLAYEVITDIATEESKGNEITEACINIKSILPNRVNIYGLSRANGGSNQIFHDRLLIIFGEEENPNVYMLSNSISGVAKKFPSVIIPVPNDVGNELVEYYLQFISGEGKYDIPKVNSVTLWPVEIHDKNNEQDNHKGEKKQFTGFEILKEILFENGVVPEEQLGSEGELLFAEDFKERIKQLEKLGEGINKLLKEDVKKAIELWCGIANWSVQIMDDNKNEMFDWFNNSYYRNDFISVTERYIREAVELEYPLGIKNMECSAECISIGKQSILPFEKMRDISSSLLDCYYVHDYPVNYSVKMALYYLVRFDPETVYEVLGLTINFVSKMDHVKITTDMLPYYKMIYLSLLEVASNLSRNYTKSDFSKLNTGLNSNVTIIRAMHVIIITKCLNSRDNPDKSMDIFEAVNKLEFLKNPCERIYSYSWIAYYCQVPRNKMRNNKNHYNLMDCIKKNIVDEWSLDFEDENFLKSILMNFCGPTEGDHSNDIFDILEILVKQCKVSKQKAIDYIQQALLEKINCHMDGKKRIYMEVDIPFTYNSIICFIKISPQKIDNLVNDIMKVADRAEKLLSNPFLRSKGYSEWKCSIETLCWCGISIIQINDNLQFKKEKLSNILKEIEQRLSLYREVFYDNNMLIKKFYDSYGKDEEVSEESKRMKNLKSSEIMNGE